MFKSLINLFKKNSNDSIEIDRNLKSEVVLENTNSVGDEDKEIILTDNEIQHYIKKEIRSRLPEPPQNDYNNRDFDPLFIDAAKIVVNSQEASERLLQRKLRIGFTRAKTLLEALEWEGIIAPTFEENQKWEVLISDLNTLHMILSFNENLINNLSPLDSFLHGSHIINEKRFEHFLTNILPLHEESIQEIVNKHLESIEIEKENELKEKLREEILEKEKEKQEKEKIRKLRTQIREELIEDGILENLNEINRIRREQIPQDILDKVWNRDGGKCTSCGSQEKIEFDHIIPISKGGANTYRNIQILCEKCNSKKSNNIG